MTLLQNPLKNPKCLLAVQTENNFLQAGFSLQVGYRCGKHNLRAAFNRKTVNTRADGREPDAFYAVFVCDFQAVECRVPEFFLFVPFSLARAYGMDNVPRL